MVIGYECPSDLISLFMAPYRLPPSTAKFDVLEKELSDKEGKVVKLASREEAAFAGKMAALETVTNFITFGLAIADLVFTFTTDDPYSNSKIYGLEVDIYNLELQVNETVTRIFEQTQVILVSMYVVHHNRTAKPYTSLPFTCVTLQHRIVLGMSRPFFKIYRPSSTSFFLKSCKRYGACLPSSSSSFLSPV